MYKLMLKSFQFWIPIQNSNNVIILIKHTEIFASLTSYQIKMPFHGDSLSSHAYCQNIESSIWQKISLSALKWCKLKYSI